jgi:hypothetical protein
MWSEDKWKLCETKVKLKSLSCMNKLDTNDFGYVSQKKGWDIHLWRNLAGYDSGIHTTSLLKNNYWPNLKDEAQEYVKNCLTCQDNHQSISKKQEKFL